MVRILLIIGAVLVVTGPLRRPILGAWKFLVSAFVGGIVGVLVVGRLIHGAPPWMMVAGPVFMAIVFGNLGRELLDDMFGRGGRNGDA